MYQFYYANGKQADHPKFKQNIRDLFDITAIRPTMWEEHCLECSAPLCFENCLHYAERSDGRCKRFENGLATFPHPNACCGDGVRVKFRKWANMMTVIFPDMLAENEYLVKHGRNRKLGGFLKKIESSKFPRAIRWQAIRTLEFLRRRSMRRGELTQVPDAFLFHAYSFYDSPYRLILEVFDGHTSVFKTSLLISSGENITVLPFDTMSTECAKSGNLVKIYPENDIEAELDILWADFVCGTPKISEKPSDKVKCVVWDLDNTLWDGTLIEVENPDALALKPNVLKTVLALDERGIIQSVASKNDFDNAFPVLQRLGIDGYFMYPQIHWNAKSGSLRSIAKSLNIGIDSFAFIDDSIFEREEVRNALPQVRIFDVSDIDTLLGRDEFCVPITEESRSRRSMYRSEEKRNELQAEAEGDALDFLRKCHLSIRIFAPKTEQEILRCYELVIRTNQLNLSGIKYTKEEFAEAFCRESHTNFAFECSDNFGEYGIVGFGQYKRENDSIVFTEFAMSCRVAGKFVESALFSFLLECEKAGRGIFRCLKTKKNILLRNSLLSIGFTVSDETDTSVGFEYTQVLLNKDIVSVKAEYTLRNNVSAEKRFEQKEQLKDKIGYID